MEVLQAIANALACALVMGIGLGVPWAVIKRSSHWLWAGILAALAGGLASGLAAFGRTPKLAYIVTFPLTGIFWLILTLPFAFGCHWWRKRREKQESPPEGVS